MMRWPLLCFLGFHRYRPYRCAEVSSPYQIVKVYSSRCARCDHVNHF